MSDRDQALIPQFLSGVQDEVEQANSRVGFFQNDRAKRFCHAQEQELKKWHPPPDSMREFGERLFHQLCIAVAQVHPLRDREHQGSSIGLFRSESMQQRLMLIEQREAKGNSALDQRIDQCLIELVNRQ